MVRIFGSIAMLYLFAAALQSTAMADEPRTASNDSALEQVAADPEPDADAPLETLEDNCPQWMPPMICTERHEGVARFGWWAVSRSGDDVKVGEYQDLSPSPFWDVDSIFSDGRQTLNFTATGLDNETSSGRLWYYNPGISADVEYDRYPRRLDHDPLRGAPVSGPLGAGDNVVTEDLNIGDDYAIRVQELKASVKGELTDNVRWRLNVWSLRKSGERQANGVGHCFDLNPAPGSQQNTCHVLSQRQQIDWVTTEIEPVIEARFDNFTVEYARTMRVFEQSDQKVYRTYTRFGFSENSGEGGPPFPYAVVPENYTQIDRLKASAKLSESTTLYGNFYNGDTENKFRGTHRTFNGFDARLISHSIDGVSLTGYAKMANEDNELPPSLIAQEDPDDIRHPVDYSRTRVGVKARWRPYRYDCDSRWSGLSVNSGYEYYYLGRDHAFYESSRLGTFTQPDTKRHEIRFGPSMRWSPSWDTYVRYDGRFTEDPLIGVRESTGRFNTNQPEQEHGVDIGGTWTPAQNFMATAQFSIVNSWNKSMYKSVAPTNLPIHFREDDYPFYLSVWYAPTDQLSLTGGYAYFSNWIEQDISTGFRFDPIDTSPWNYAGKDQLVSLNANYACSSRVRLIGGFEWGRGSNVFSPPLSTTGADWSALPSFSDVIVETTRYRAGVDFEVCDGIVCYCHYNYFDYEDKTEDFNSGTAHFLLAGTMAKY